MILHTIKQYLAVTLTGKTVQNIPGNRLLFLEREAYSYNKKVA
jgi:hypothetical protein